VLRLATVLLALGLGRGTLALWRRAHPAEASSAGPRVHSGDLRPQTAQAGGTP